jgi:hypothetical protein
MMFCGEKVMIFIEKMKFFGGKIEIFWMGYLSYTSKVIIFNFIKNFEFLILDSFNNIALAIHGGAGSMAAIPPELLDTVKFSLFLVVVTGLETLIQTRNSLEVRIKNT